jgi:peptide/nickel transport system substrate-binding protein
MSRRDVLKRALGLAAVVPLGTALLAACGDDDAVDPVGGAADTEDVADDSDVVGSPVPDRERRRGGTVRVGFAGSIDTFDPHHPVVFEGIWAQSMIYSRLVRLNSDLEVVPDLAVAWEPNEDGTEWTYHLREGIKFHDGRDFSVKDVKSSFERLIDPAEGAPMASELAMVDSVEVMSDTEVVIHLNRPYAGFGVLAGMYYMRIVPIEQAGQLQTQPNGTGPYRLRTHSAGERTVLERFEDYYDVENQAFLDRIEYITIPEDTSRIAALTGGTINLINEVPPTALPMVRDRPGIVVESVPTGSYSPISMRFDLDPFTDVRVRKAIKLVVDREEFLQAVIRGEGVVGRDHPVPPIDPMHADDLPVPERNIEEAKALLAEAGYENGIDLELHTTPGRVGLLESALTFQEMAQAAGIRVEVVSHPVDAYWADVYLEVPFFMNNWSARPLAEQALAAGYLSTAGWNSSKWVNERFDELVQSASETLDEEERQEILREAQELLAEDGTVLISYFISMNGAWSEKVKGFRMHPLRWVELHEAWVDE